ncbi:M56 family metallopeptidase [Saccharopolyspora sp. CA-218241]|uniref:M56 family metallopeptidase n=1 Tax=Saccharopolyspora sp. CA-218241 TaxID=3240027 RepID=UPI003D983E04
MTPLLVVLSLYAAIVAVLGPRLVRACRRWEGAAPRLGLALWIALPTSWVVAVFSLGLAAIAALSGGLGLAGLLHACLHAVQVILGVHHPSDVPAALALIGSLAFLLRLAAVAARHARRTRRHRRAHRRAVRGLSRNLLHHGRWITVVDAAEPAAYCLPGRVPAIVVTRGAVRRLRPPEFAAVLAHEAAHLRGKHHLCAGWVAVLAQSFPFVPVLRAAVPEVARLVEWIADDRAGRDHGSRTVARALAAMATAAHPRAPAPRAALAAAGSDVPERVERLLRPRPPARSAHWRITVALALPLLALTAATALVVPSATADPTPLCAGPGVVAELR